VLALRIKPIRLIPLNYLRITNFIYPNLSTFPGGQPGREGYSANWHVPIDDNHHWKYAFVFKRESPLGKERIRGVREEMTADYKPIHNKANRYLQDRDSMKAKVFSGIGFNFAAQDACVTGGAGIIQDRTIEHLASTDKAIVAARKLLLKAIGDVREEREAPHVIRGPELHRFPHLVVMSEVIPSSIDWKEYARRAEAEIGM